MADIAGSDRRRKALETMWKAEQDKVTAERQSAVDDYNSLMKNAPDFGDDEEGLLRASWENKPHVRAIKDRMTAHIEASLVKSKELTAGAAGLQVGKPSGDPRHPGEAGSPQERPVAKKYQGFDAKPKPKFEVKRGEMRKVGKVEIELSGEVAYKDGKVFYMGMTKDGQVVGIPEAELGKKFAKKDPEVEPTGEEYRGISLFRKAGRAATYVDPKFAEDF
jgi:hypothetical protein